MKEIDVSEPSRRHGEGREPTIATRVKSKERRALRVRVKCKERRASRVSIIERGEESCSAVRSQEVCGVSRTGLPACR